MSPVAAATTIAHHQASHLAVPVARMETPHQDHHSMSSSSMDDVADEDATTSYDDEEEDDDFDEEGGGFNKKGRGHGSSSNIDHDDHTDPTHASTDNASNGANGGAESEKLRGKLNAFFVLLIAAVALGLIQYFLTKRQEDIAFQAQYHGFADKIARESNRKVRNLVSATEGLAVSAMSLAEAQNATWPLFVQPSFARNARDSCVHLAGASFVALSPIVHGAAGDRNSWEKYAFEHQGDWIVHQDRYGTDTVEPNIPFYIHSEPGGVPVFPGTPGPFSPVWQTSHLYDTSVVNFDLFANRNYSDLVKFVVDPHQQPALSGVLNASSLFGPYSVPDSNGQPQVILVYPVFKNAEAGADKKVIVAHIVAVVSLEVFFQELLPKQYQQGHRYEREPELEERGHEHHGHQEQENKISTTLASDVDVVVRNTCGQNFTFAIQGHRVEYLGPEDLHDVEFEYMERRAPFADLVVIDNNASSFDDNKTFGPNDDEFGGQYYCKYELFMYPTEDLQDSHDTSEASLVMGMIVLVAFAAAIFFIAYDVTVQRRHENLLRKISHTNKILRAVFPDIVRSRLENEISAQQQQQQGGINGENGNEQGAKRGLRNFLKAGVPKLTDGMEEITPLSKPIADLFPNTTVLFADICGFTAWSSVREPSQVFTLLEAVFSTFDAIARKMGVFKVETVGDSYVAVCGLPEARDDHALVMAKFARRCVNSVGGVVRSLEMTLGPDTSDLAVRIGLHSGPCTAGVLRGERSRFQLFGDTVNTAARMESNGKRNKIHMSSDTAQLLRAAGKEDWIEEREDVIVAKGKGALLTYWLKTHRSEGSQRNSQQGSSTNNDRSDNELIEISERTTADGDLQETKLETAQKSVSSQKVQRLIGWNTELLLNLLKKIVARRVAQKKRSPTTAAVMQRVRSLEERMGKNTSALSEMVEIIKLPDFDANTAKHEGDGSNARDLALDEEVTAQLRDFVALIQGMYRDDNPFHCFEHASHVTMSVSKLLSRIVAPDEIEKILHNDAAQVNLALHEFTYGITSDPLTQFAVVLAALCHDVDHRGVPNTVLIKEEPNMAEHYNRKSVAEQNSVDLAWNALMDPTFEDLRACIYTNEAELRRFRRGFVNSIMATDIFDDDHAAMRKNRWEEAFAQESAAATGGGIPPGGVINRKASIVLEHLIQASDIAHTMQHWHVYRKWNALLFEETHKAYVRGRIKKNPADGWYEGELAFFDDYVLPLAKKLNACGVFGVASDEYLNYAVENRDEWEHRGVEVVRALAEKHGAVHA